ncbi:hypothetical protein M2451_002830 [Dysgonomonas sp. PFB1-18]|uniref:hypothetical protein n=1 Tax=unclassified Dysgonomonas TaxID=2630389 RepID=UPI002473A8A5|nr:MULTISPECIES: hypothetical protein [unclassified Dysgonomonas]MDH6309284.1 hypothetical protein [Dysgonomonas sp. PF1-14]MDH6339851.1 hypothetical protein [Dysgonomonas sp. PF1-16]MDH6381499.1 hypothetical protein [Dysgonomonas sp. PFB1-18]MDH6398714.1 hypothetical protein [Dysgonomonas sp. PF1-23]
MDLQTKIDNAIPKDKLLHFCSGLLLAQFAYIWIWLLFLPVIAGFGKELYDKYVRKTRFDWYDAAATIAGGMSVAAVITIKILLL